MNGTLNPLNQLVALGQKLWLDELGRGLLRGGELSRLIDRDGVSGVTSNPAIFQQALGADSAYREAIVRQWAAGAGAAEIYESLVLEDVREAADRLRKVYRAGGGEDGFVSLEVSPLLSADTEATLAEARRLWRAIGRPNLMIKVPATREGVPAIRQLIAEGINVNATLLFGVGRYREVREAFVTGLELRRAAGEPLGTVSAVASVFISRIDTLVDGRLAPLCEQQPAARALQGKTGIALARFLYQDFRQFCASPRWKSLAAHGARPQKLLWASTGTKNPHYSDVKYVDALIGRDTVTTLPLKTLTAYRDHGRPAIRLCADPFETASLPAQLLELGIDLESVGRELEAQGVEKFSASFAGSLAGIAGQCGE